MRVLWTIALLLVAVTACAQDAMVSQVYRLQSWMNPALTGYIEHDYRAQTHHRRQWPGLQAPFVTTFVQAEVKAWESGYDGHHIGAGLVVLQDQLGNRTLNQFEVHGAGAVNLAASNYNHWAFGLQVGYVRRTLNPDNLSWDNQYNGVGYDPSLPSGENFTASTRGYVDAGFGVVWSHDRLVHWRFGYAAHHFLQNRTLLVRAEDTHRIRHTFMWDTHADFRGFDMDYYALFMRQAGAQVVQFGALAAMGFGLDSRYTTARSSSAVLTGLTYRWGDALTPAVGIRWKQLGEVLLSYDVTLSAWRRAVDYRGGWEINLRYDGFFSEKRRRLK